MIKKETMNIHVLPTDKPSRLGKFIDTNNLFLRTSNDIPRGENVYIYITSDEEIKEGDWYFFNVGYANGIKKADKNDVRQIHLEIEPKKIILTTDQDLINDGVQSIDDEFLEWFVKNPSCEEVDVVDLYGYPNVIHTSYKMVIPSEQPKQETLTYTEAAKKEERIFNSSMMSKETLEDITLEEVFGSAYCQFSVVENKLAILYRNQEQLLKAIKLLSNEK